MVPQQDANFIKSWNIRDGEDLMSFQKIAKFSLVEMMCAQDSEWQWTTQLNC